MVTEHFISDHDLRKDIKILVKTLFFLYDSNLQDEASSYSSV